MHEASPAALNVPRMHASQVVAPVAENVPEGHRVCSSAAAPPPMTKKPALAGEQLDDPSADANLPVSHFFWLVARGSST